MWTVLLNLVILPFVLSKLPWVKAKSFLACVIVSVIASVLQLILWIASAPVTSMALFIVGIIPLLNLVMVPLLVFVISLFFNTLALYAADILIEDFEISSMEDTIKTSAILSFISAVLNLI